MLQIQGAAKIYNTFEILTTCLKHLKRILNISNAFETCFKISQRI